MISIKRIKINLKKFDNSLFLTFLILALFLYTRYFTNLTFGDEYDNFTYSWLLRNGYLPYRDFFTHHFPTLIFAGLPLEIIAHTKIAYRVFVLFALFSFFSFFFYYFKGLFRYTILAFMIFSSYAISFYAGFQYADGTFWAIFTLSAFFIVIKKDGTPFEPYESRVLAVLIFLTALSSPMHLIAFFFLGAYHFFVQIKVKKRFSRAENIANLKQIFGVLAAGSLLFFFYLVLTGSLSDFYYSTFIFNNNYFYFRDHVQIIQPRVADFYLHSTLDFLNHLNGLKKTEGVALVTFLKSLKASFTPGSIVNYPDYLKIIFTDLYNNFFSFEIFILLFYIFGFITLFFNKRKTLAVFSAMFILAIRLRVPERIHQAPYYFFSYWLLAIAFAISLENVCRNKKKSLNLLVMIVMLLIITLFIRKNWYDFDQIAFNTFPKNNLKTVNYLKATSHPSDKILVISNDSASYYYDSGRFPYGYFVNYFAWYNLSDKLRSRWLDDITTYKGNYLIVSNEFWDSYKVKGDGEKWVVDTLRVVEPLYALGEFRTYGKVFYRKNRM